MKIGIAGMGAIGLRVAQELDQGGIPGCTLAGFSARSAPRATEANAQLSTPVPCYELGEIADHCDLVIETLPPALFNDLAVPVLTAGKTLMVLSASQLLGRQDLLIWPKRLVARSSSPLGRCWGLMRSRALGSARSTLW